MFAKHDQRGRPVVNSLLIDRKLSIAMRKTQLTSFQQRVSNDKQTYDDKIILAHDPDAHNRSISTTFLPTIMRDCLMMEIPPSKRVRNLYDRIINITKSNMKIQHRYLSQITENINSISGSLPQFEQWVSRIAHCPELYTLFSLHDELSDLLEHIGEIHKPSKFERQSVDDIKDRISISSWNRKRLNLTVQWSHHLALIEYKGQKWLAPRIAIQQLHNKISDLLSVMILATFQEGVCLDNHMKTLTSRFVIALCSLHIAAEDSYFEFAGSLEGLGMAIILHRTEEWLNDHLLTNLTNEIPETIRYNPYYQSIIDMFTSPQTSIAAVTELSCLCKITGHPYVDTLEGVTKVYNRVNEQLTIDLSAVAYTICAAKRSFILNYYHKNHKWPGVEYAPTICSGLRAAIHTNRSPEDVDIEKDYPAISIYDYININFLPCVEFQHLENIIAKLKDKSISIHRSPAVLKYLSSQSFDHNPQSVADYRLLLHYLLTPEYKLDVQRYMTNYCNDTSEMDLSYEYLAIRLVPKEKELKTAARHFGCKTYEDRFRSIVQEQNVADFMEEYSSNQAMTLSELALIKKLYSFSNLRKLYTDRVVFMISFDAKGWNNKFRKETVEPVVRESLSQIFGNDIFDKTHNAYEKCLFYVPDYEGTYYWEGQGGGIEGLNQYTWTYVYLFQSEYAFMDVPAQVHSVIKGDDWRAAVAIAKSHIGDKDHADVAREIMEKIKENAAGFGHEIKVQESYASEQIIAFSKVIHYKDLILPSGFRKVQKCYGATNAFLPLLHDYITSSYSNAHSTCYLQPNHYPTFMVALFWATSYIVRHPIYSPLTDKQLTALLLTPGCVGGLPIIFLGNMLVRAESDHLPTFIHLIQTVETYDKEIATYMKNFLNFRIPNKLPWGLLAKDPYSLAQDKPPTATLYLKQIIRNQLDKYAKNDTIIQLLQYTTEREKEALLTTLASAAFWPAKLHTALYNATPMALMEELLSSFVSAKSILDLLISTNIKKPSAMRILSTAISIDTYEHRWRAQTLTGQRNFIPRGDILTSICPMQAADVLRQQTWGKRITTVTQPPVAHTIRIYEEDYILHDSHAQLNHFQYHVVPDRKYITSLQCDGYAVPATGVVKDPFFGHTTGRGLSEPKIKIIERDPETSKLLDLLCLSSWVNLEPTAGCPNPNAVPVVQHIIKYYTDIPPEEMIHLGAAHISGTQTHRLRAQGFCETIMPNNLPNIYHLITGQSNTHVKFTHNPTNYVINFLQIFCQTVCSLSTTIEFTPSICTRGNYWAVTTECEYCNRPIEEEPIHYTNLMFLNTQPRFCTATTLTAASVRLVKSAIEDLNSATTFDSPIPTINEDIDELRTAMAFYICHITWMSRHYLTMHMRLHRANESQAQQAADLISWNLPNISIAILQAITPDIYVNILILYIAEYLNGFLYIPTYEIFSSNTDAIHGDALPWLPLIEKFKAALILPEVITAMQRRSGLSIPSGASTNTHTATKYIGRAAFTIIRGYEGVPPMYNDIVYFMKGESMAQRAHKLKFRVSLIKRASWDDTILGQIIDIDTCFTQFLYAICPPPTEEDVIRAFENEDTHIAIFDANRLTIELIQDYIDHPHKHEWITRRFYRTIDNYVAEVSNMSDVSYIRLLKEYLAIPESREELLELIRITADAIPIEYLEIKVYELSEVTDRLRATRIDSYSLPSAEIITHPYDTNFLPIQPTTSRYGYYLPCPMDGPVVQCNEDIVLNPLPSIHCPAVNRAFPDLSKIIRIYGENVASASKTLLILKSLGLDTQYYRESLRGYVVTLGEGQGGTLDMLLRIFPRCQGLFNTLLIDPQYGHRPDASAADASVYSRIDFRLVQRGVTDLRSINTINVLIAETIKFRRPPLIIHCDAEFSGNPYSATLIPDGVHVWANVIHYFLSVRDASTILILKVLIYEYQYLTTVLTTLARYAKVWIYLCPASRMGYEIYIISQRIRSEYTLTSPYTGSQYNNNIGIYVRNFLHFIINDMVLPFNAGEEQYKDDVILELMYSEPQSSYFQEHSLPIRATLLCQTVCGLLVTKYSFPGVDFRQKMTNLYTLLRIGLMESLEVFEHPTAEITRHLRSTQSTLMHKITLFKSLLTKQCFSVLFYESYTSPTVIPVYTNYRTNIITLISNFLTTTDQFHAYYFDEVECILIIGEYTEHLNPIIIHSYNQFLTIYSSVYHSFI